MADMHVIEGPGKGIWRVVMHFDVPDIDNTVSVNFRTALVNSGRNLVSVLEPGDGLEGTISTAEQLQLTNGEVFEHEVDLDLEGPGTTNSSRIQLLKDQYAIEEALTVETLKGRLKFFGFNQARA